MRFNPEQFKVRATKHFDTAWHDGPSILTEPLQKHRYPQSAYRQARSHPVFDTIQKLRETYLSIGFDEAENPIIIDEQDVYRQFGPEAMAVLDRVFYLGGLPRPNVGIRHEQFRSIEQIIGSVLDSSKEEQFRTTLHGYKKGEIDGDELVHELACVLSCDDAKVVEILDQVFPEFRALAPQSSRQTLRSHMTSGWFMTLGALWDRVELPIKLFSVDRCFRREQAEDAQRLMTYHSASCIVAGDDVTLDDGKAVSRALLEVFGYTDFRFQPDDKRSKYYMPDTQTEVYARHPTQGWVEVATFGLYSPLALAEYDIGVPVMNLGLGVERLAMIATEATDIRQMVHPQFFRQSLSDFEIAKSVILTKEPQTRTGRALVKTLASTAHAHYEVPGPCSFLVFDGELEGQFMKIYLEEPEEGAKLCGPACLNEIVVHDGCILGLPDTEKFASTKKEGVSTGITYLHAVLSEAVADIEHNAHLGQAVTFQTKMSKLAGDINIKIADHVLRYITDNNKKIDLRGPVFLTIRSELYERE
ncbi:MAG: O-phosphoserine--tRNA ligase [Methanomicrobiales archaeon]|jgi:O-phosphoseryl-tRNA synthetase|nr:O-phosphoserine--tRNA ligase [Methanomicrobiales archaeon]